MRPFPFNGHVFSFQYNRKRFILTYNAQKKCFIFKVHNGTEDFINEFFITYYLKITKMSHRLKLSRLSLFCCSQSENMRKDLKATLGGL